MSMVLNTERVRRCLKEFDLTTLFIEELGWDHENVTHEVTVDAKTFVLNTIAEKRGMVAFVCEPSGDEAIPDRATRQKIERQVAKTFYEHLILFVDAERTTQIWQWARREPGRSIATREHTYHITQPGDSLILKLRDIAFSIDEEEKLTLVSVTERAGRAFDVDRVTKRFYDRFKTEHAAFLKFIKGIPDDSSQRWYASVMINRLMFIYFIQKKGFLDGNNDYLRTKLVESKRRGKDRYYREFLQTLFFEGFAQKREDRSDDAKALLGNIPYLDGGLFLRHEIEEKHGDALEIADEAFEKLFAFFEGYHWQLDERPLRADNEINPDVLGYIFEKYINQKQMGAYYTKEDITGYISRNTVIPRILDIARENCKVAFEPDGSLWRLLQEDPDRYIYPAVKHGITVNARVRPGEKPQRLERPYELPPEIAAGINPPTLHQPVGDGPALTLELRKAWNRPAPPEYALPTEIWREVVARRKRYEEVHAKLASGEVHEINDLITYNLDIEQFARDVINKCEGPELLRAIWHAIRDLSVLDPTCGSGAFLFAALNILYDLYDDCLDRMQMFVEEADRAGHPRSKYSDFRAVLEQMEKHPNRRYFILKSIILNNLYGVDIMEEAIEICKLRLFLKLVAQVNSPDKIEPLPDIDFNIRAGNTLVGFATYDEVKKAVTSDQDQMKLQFDDTMKRIDEKAQDVEHLFARFREQQTTYGGEVTPAAKENLRKKLSALEDELNRYLAKEYGVDVDGNGRGGSRTAPTEAYRTWLASHKPFHWFVEFYGILHKRGGFDVIIGNPPYVDYRKVKDEYTIRGYQTEGCGNLYAFVLERSLHTLRTHGRTGMIVPISSICTDRSAPLQRILRKHHVHLSHYCGDRNPAEMFDGVKMRLTICLVERDGQCDMYTTRYNKWFTIARPYLFDQLAYQSVVNLADVASIAKAGSDTEAKILRELLRRDPSLAVLHVSDGQGYYYHNAPIHWVRAFTFAPLFWSERDGERVSDHYKTIWLDNDKYTKRLIALMNSSLFYLWFVWVSNCRDLSARDIWGFQCDPRTADNLRLEGLTEQLMACYKSISQVIEVNYRTTGIVRYEQIDTKRCKPIIDEIDRVLAQHYGFTEEELDFIINYDIKYRMGLDNLGGDGGGEG